MCTRCFCSKEKLFAVLLFRPVCAVFLFNFRISSQKLRRNFRSVTFNVCPRLLLNIRHSSTELSTYLRSVQSLRKRFA